MAAVVICMIFPIMANRSKRFRGASSKMRKLLGRLASFGSLILVPPLAFGISLPVESQGVASYSAHCAMCHGADLMGAAGAALKGENFLRQWRGKEDSLYELIAKQMPLGAPGSLSETDYKAIFSFVVSRAGLGGHSDAAATRAVTISTPSSAFPMAPVGSGTSSVTGPDDAELSRAAPADWLMYNRDYLGQRFSPLAQITPANVKSLSPQCIFQTGEIGSFEASPLVWGSKLFVTTVHHTFAIDAATCHSLWTNDYTPTDREVLPANRGVALYKGKLYRGTADGHLLALDAADGHLLWDVHVNDSSRGYFLSSAPTAFADKVFVGEAGADWGATGHIYAFDAVTGQHLWTFDAIPTGRQPGARSWEGEQRSGGSHWSTITVDPATRRLYVPLGNPGSDFNARPRPGDNLYSNSIVVLDADSGRLLWYVQQIPHDTHDWDTAAAPVIYSQDGKNFMAVGSKDSRLYLYDRDTHKLQARTNIGRRLNDTVPLSASEPLHVCPGILGGVEWNGPAYDPKSKLLFVNAVDFCATIRVDTPEEASGHAAGGVNMGGKVVFDPAKTADGLLMAIDAASGVPVWTFNAGSPMLAGVTPTASGLVFTGSAAGDFLAFDAKTGRKLYTFYTGGAIAGGVSTYEVAGRQYVAVPFGNSSKSVWGMVGSPSLIIFSLKLTDTE